MKIFDKIYTSINNNLEKKENNGVTSIVPPFERLAKKYPGWVQGTYTIISASSGINL